jgi:hypothetical protein
MQVPRLRDAVVIIERHVLNVVTHAPGTWNAMIRTKARSVTLPMYVRVGTTAPLMWLMCRNLHSSTTVTLFPVAAVWSSALLPV